MYTYTKQRNKMHSGVLRGAAVLYGGLLPSVPQTYLLIHSLNPRFALINAFCIKIGKQISCVKLRALNSVFKVTRVSLAGKFRSDGTHPQQAPKIHHSLYV